MAFRPRYVLSIAVCASKVGYVFLIDGTPYDWGISLQANASTTAAQGFTTEWIAYYQPERVITERIATNSNKGERSRELNNAIWKAAQIADVEWACADRVQRYANKYDEADALAARFPEMKPWVPRRRMLWDEEPRRTIIFEALSLALQALQLESMRED